VLSQHAGDTTVLLDPDGGEYFALDAVGCRVWELCDGSRSLEEIADVLAEEYDAPRDEIMTDVSALVAELDAATLIENPG
jgi:pyrroloquinoline quinone biosynthesis protein D